MCMGVYMSRSLMLKGTFKNGKTRQIGCYNGINCDYLESFFTPDDALFMLRRSADTTTNNTSFDYCIEAKKFTKLECIIVASYHNGTTKRHEVELELPDRITTDYIMQLTKIANDF